MTHRGKVKLKKPPTKTSHAGKRAPRLAAELEQTRSHSGRGKYLLRLYVSGSTLKSERAIENINRACEEHLKGRYDLEVIDIFNQPNLARDEQIVAVPTLIKRLPLPLQKLVGDMSDLTKVLFGLDLRMRP
jgi:circadian clock protein KaiB